MKVEEMTLHLEVRHDGRHTVCLPELQGHMGNMKHALEQLKSDLQLQVGDLLTCEQMAGAEHSF